MKNFNAKIDFGQIQNNSESKQAVFDLFFFFFEFDALKPMDYIAMKAGIGLS